MKLDLNAFKSSLRSNTVSVLKYLLSKVEEKPVPVKQEPVKQEAEKEKAEAPKVTKENFWASTKAVLNPDKDAVLNTVLENVKRDLTQRSVFEGSLHGANASGNIASLNKILLPVTSRGIRGLANLRQLVAFQAMEGPVSNIHTLRVRENEGRLSIQVLKEVAEAKTRKLSARWSFEASGAGPAVEQGVDIEAEILAALSQEITCEVEQHVLRDLREVATKTYFDLDEATSETFVGSNKGDLLIQRITEEADTIRQRTRRGPANWVVINTKVYSLLKNASTRRFSKNIEPTKVVGGLDYVGVIDDEIKVFVDRFANDEQVILVGYKGPGEIDAGYYYCPYVFVTSTGVVIDPQTFEPVISFMTRFGSLTVQAETYYTAIKLGKEPEVVAEPEQEAVEPTVDPVEQIIQNVEAEIASEAAVEATEKVVEEEKKDTH